MRTKRYAMHGRKKTRRLRKKGGDGSSKQITSAIKGTKRRPEPLNLIGIEGLNQESEVNEHEYEYGFPKELPRKTSSLPKKWDGRVEYINLMTAYIESQNKILSDLQNKTPNIQMCKTEEEKKQYFEILENLRQLNIMINKEFVNKYINKQPENEKKAREFLNNIFRDQINILNLKNNIEHLFGLIKTEFKKRQISYKNNPRSKSNNRRRTLKEIQQIQRKSLKKGVSLTIQEAENLLKI